MSETFPLAPKFADLRGKAVLVTGASTGIGAAVARAFGACGAHVAIHYHRSAPAAETVAEAIRGAGGSAHLVQADLSTASGPHDLVLAAAGALGGLDVLVNNAGGPEFRQEIASLSDAEYDHLMDLNFRAVFAASRAAIPHLAARGGGSIISTTSCAARHGGGPGTVLYAAAKAAVGTFTRGLAKELAPHRIRVNAVSPGYIDTALHERLSSGSVKDWLIRQVPMGRAGSAAECAGAYLYLASEELSSYVTGQTIEVNGGWVMP